MRYIPNTNNAQGLNTGRQSAEQEHTVNMRVPAAEETKSGSRQQKKPVLQENRQQGNQAYNERTRNNTVVPEYTTNSAGAAGRLSSKRQATTEEAVKTRYKESPQQNKERPPTAAKSSGGKGFSSILGNILPPSVYNSQSKKLFGFLNTEDLLLIALIFWFAESDSEDSSLLSLALIYILVSEHFDLPDLLF